LFGSARKSARPPPGCRRHPETVHVTRRGNQPHRARVFPIKRGAGGARGGLRTARPAPPRAVQPAETSPIPTKTDWKPTPEQPKTDHRRHRKRPITARKAATTAGKCAITTENVSAVREPTPAREKARPGQGCHRTATGRIIAEPGSRVRDGRCQTTRHYSGESDLCRDGRPGTARTHRAVAPGTNGTGPHGNPDRAGSTRAQQSAPDRAPTRRSPGGKVPTIHLRASRECMTCGR
jgi:hypothetical protein